MEIGSHDHAAITVRHFAASLVITLLLFPGLCRAKELPIGISAALSGPTQALGQGMKSGIEAYFNKINAAGGINGNTLKLVALDDGYEPQKCGPNMRELIDQEHVLAVIGNVGTPTAVVSVPIANEKKTLLFGAMTGAGLLRNTPPDRYIINYRASYADETAAMVDGFMKIGIKPSEIAFFTQNDGYGNAGYQGAIEALKAKGYADAENLPHGRYTRNTVNVEDALTTIASSNSAPKAIIMVGAYKPCAAFIKMAKEFFPDTIYANVSFVGSVALAKELGDMGDGVVVTQVVPHFESDLPAIVQFRGDIAKVGGTPGFVALEGYLAAKIFVEGLKRAGDSVTKETIIDAIESINNFDIGTGVPVSLSKEKHQASSTVWPTVVKDGKYSKLDWADLK